MITVLIILLFTAVGALAYQNRTLQQQISAIPTPTPTPLPSETPVEWDTANWKTYTNSKLGFSIQYPSNLRVSQEPQPYKNNLGGTTWLLSIDDREDGDVAGKTIRTSILVQFNDKPISGESGLPITKIENTVMGIENATYLNIQNYPAVKGRQKLNPDQNGVAQETTLFVTILQDKLLWSIMGNIKSTKDVEINTVDQILSTFKFVDPISIVTPTPQPLPTKVLGILSTTGWKMVANNRVAFDIPNYASCDNDIQCSTITYTNYFQGTPSPLPAKITVSVTDYRGGSRRQQYLDTNKSVIECKPLFVESLFGRVDALQIPIDGGWCQGGYVGGIVSVVGNKFVVIGPSLTYNDNKEISRWDVRDTIVSTLSLITE
jgi:hypothetical protein